jgi:hypothetical protein
MRELVAAPLERDPPDRADFVGLLDPDAGSPQHRRRAGFARCATAGRADFVSLRAPELISFGQQHAQNAASRQRGDSGL